MSSDPGKFWRDLSIAQSGRGVGLPQQTSLTQLATPLSIGQSPGPGTMATLYLLTNNDHAYDGATISWFVKQFGRLALFATSTISPVDNANSASLVYVQSGFAADFWEVTITLTGATTPAARLQSAIVAQGVEDIPSPSTIAPLSSTATYTGPSGAGSALFSLPYGTSTWSVTLTARIISSAVDPVGKSYTTNGDYSWETDSTGTVTEIVPVVAVWPMESADALMATMDVPSPDVAGGQAEISYVLPTGLDASTVTRVTVNLFPLALVT